MQAKVRSKASTGWHLFKVLKPCCAPGPAVRGLELQHFSLWIRSGRRVGVRGLHEGRFAGDVGRVPSPGRGRGSQNGICN